MFVFGGWARCVRSRVTVYIYKGCADALQNLPRYRAAARVRSTSASHLQGKGIERDR